MNTRGRLLVKIVPKKDQSNDRNVKEYFSVISTEESPIIENAMTTPDIFQKKDEENYNSSSKQTSPNQQPPLQDENQSVMSTEESTNVVQSLLETRVANLNTSGTQFSDHNVNDYNTFSSNEESFIEDSDADPSFSAPKKKKKKLIPIILLVPVRQVLQALAVALILIPMMKQ